MQAACLLIQIKRDFSCRFSLIVDEMVEDVVGLRFWP